MRGISSILSKPVTDVVRWFSNQPNWAIVGADGYGPNPQFVDKILNTLAAIKADDDFEIESVMKAQFGGGGFEELIRAASCVANAQLDPIGFMSLYMGSLMIQDGLKVIQPSGEQCSALEHVNINMTFGEYEQPFPVTVLHLPDSFRDQITEEYGCECPPFIASYHERESNCVFVLSYDPAAYDLSNPSRYAHFARFFRPDRDTQQIEDQLGNTDLLGHCPLSAREDEMMVALSRVALNTCLLLTYLGVKDLGNPEIDRLRDLVQGKPKSRAKRRKQAQARKRLAEAQEVRYIAFEQQIEFADYGNYDDPEFNESAPTSESGRMRSSPRPHWRRGHIKRVPCGPGRVDRRKVFIKPVMVRRDRYVGKLEDAEATYHPK